jgi:hypothetical protein
MAATSSAGLVTGDAENWFGGVVTSIGIDQPVVIRPLDQELVRACADK